MSLYCISCACSVGTHGIYFQDFVTPLTAIKFSAKGFQGSKDCVAPVLWVTWAQRGSGSANKRGHVCVAAGKMQDRISSNAISSQYVRSSSLQLLSQHGLCFALWMLHPAQIWASALWFPSISSILQTSGRNWRPDQESWLGAQLLCKHY